MRYVNFFMAIVILSILGGCKTLDCKPDKGVALEGTETAIVGLYIDKNGYPQANVKSVKVYPGQKIIFAGPDKFDIFFKDQKTPTGRFEIPSSNGVVTIEIPNDVFEREQRESKSTDTKKELIYRYGIRANGKVTDPEIVVARR